MPLCCAWWNRTGCGAGKGTPFFLLFLQRWFGTQGLMHARQCWEWMTNYLTEVTTINLRAGSKTTVSSSCEGSRPRLLRPPPRLRTGRHKPLTTPQSAIPQTPTSITPTPLEDSFHCFHSTKEERDHTAMAMASVKQKLDL